MTLSDEIIQRVQDTVSAKYQGHPEVEAMVQSGDAGLSPQRLRDQAQRLRSRIANHLGLTAGEIELSSPVFERQWADYAEERATEEAFAMIVSPLVGTTDGRTGNFTGFRVNRPRAGAVSEFFSLDAYRSRHAGDAWIPGSVRTAAERGAQQGALRARLATTGLESAGAVRETSFVDGPTQSESSGSVRRRVAGLFSRGGGHTDVASDSETVDPVVAPASSLDSTREQVERAYQVCVGSMAAYYQRLFLIEDVLNTVEASFSEARTEVQSTHPAVPVPTTYDAAVSDARVRAQLQYSAETTLFS